MTRIGAAFWLLASVAMAGPAWAQPGGGAISGSVTASTGLALPGVTVTLHNSSAGADRVVETQTNGSYVFTGLPVQGTYEIQAELQGFATVVHSSVSLVEGQRLTVDFTLYAATAEALVVTGRVATL